MLSTTQPFVRLAQISDLHFIKNLTEKGRKHFLKQFLTRSHAFGKIEALSDEFRKIEKPSWGAPIEVLIATGDISTDGSTDALNTALTFFDSHTINDNHGIFVTFGLDKKFDHRLVLPGNHDRYTATWFPQQVSSTELENVFKTPNLYPYCVGYRPAAFTSSSDPTLLFFVFDSTLAPSASAWAWNRVARGRVELADCQEMLRLIAEIKAKGQVEDMNGGTLDVDFDKTFRIALLHHHPVRKSLGSPWTLFGNSTKMENARIFIEHCFQGEIDLILFGHQHQEYYDTFQPISRGRSWQPPAGAHDIYYFCCYSTSEYSENINGFYLIDFYDNGFKVTPYHWNSASFVKQAEIARPYMRNTF